MTEYSDCQVKEFFAATAEDWTPGTASHSVCVLHAPASRATTISSLCASVLSDEERDRARRFIADEHRTLFIQRRAFRRYCGALALDDGRPLADVPFQETERGMPHLPDLPAVSFSFSGCRSGFLGAWSSRYRVGVDIEEPAGPLDGSQMADCYFAPAETAAVEVNGGKAGQRTFLHLWSLKEAALKSVGEGLPFGLDQFQFELGSTPRIVAAPEDYGGPTRFKPYLIGKAEQSAALVTWRGSGPSAMGN